jgi:hypothetical protein
MKRKSEEISRQILQRTEGLIQELLEPVLLFDLSAVPEKERQLASKMLMASGRGARDMKALVKQLAVALTALQVGSARLVKKMPFDKVISFPRPNSTKAALNATRWLNSWLPHRKSSQQLERYQAALQLGAPSFLLQLLLLPSVL